ncbi:hypothetical protein Bca101_081289 [Brassica carinata]
MQRTTYNNNISSLHSLQASLMSALQCLTFLFLFLLLQVPTPASTLPLGRRRPILDNSNHSNFAKHPRRVVFPVNRGSCDLFSGEWVRDEAYPLYRAEECGGGMIDRGFDCQTYGRPDSDYLKFRWKPFNCDVPRFNGVKFLQEMRNKTIMFVGDSLGRNQWESLMCMISSSAPFVHTHIIHGDPLSTFKIPTTLKLDEISVDASNAWRTADVLLFNTGHWWSHTGSLRGPNEWTSGAKASTITQRGKTCYGQTTPFSGTSYPTSSYVDQKKVIDEVVKEMKSHVSLMDISMLSALRIDGHPSIYSGDLNPSLKKNPDRSSDCSHWCLPGLPDTWNHFPVQTTKLITYHRMKTDS